MALLEGLPVIAEDLLEGVFVDPLPCGGHRARLYHVLGTEASRFFTLLSPSLPIASPGGAGRIRDLEKGNSYTLNLAHQECWNAPVHTGLSLPVMAWKPRKRRGSGACREKAPTGETL